MSPPICQVWPKGNFTGNCSVLGQYFAPPSWYTALWIGLLVGLIVTSVYLGIRVYYERGYGRFLWKHQGIVGVGKYGAGPGVLGKITRFTERLAMFDTGRKGIRKLIAIMPGSIVQLEQKMGGIAFAQVDLDAGTTVNPDVAAWADNCLGELADSHNWQDFTFKWKLRELEELEAKPRRFPPLADINPDEPVTVPVINGGRVLTQLAPVKKKTSEMSDEDKAWWQGQMEYEDRVLESSVELSTILKAALSHSKKYEWKGVKIPLTGRKKQDLAERFSKELKDSDGDVAHALIGGQSVSAQSIAAVMVGMPWASYIQGLWNDFLELARKEIKGEFAKYIPVAIAFAIIIGAIILGYGMLQGFAHG